MRRFFSWVHAAKKFDPQWSACFLVMAFLARELRGWVPPVGGARLSRRRAFDLMCKSLFVLPLTAWRPGHGGGRRAVGRKR